MPDELFSGSFIILNETDLFTEKISFYVLHFDQVIKNETDINFILVFLVWPGLRSEAFVIRVYTKRISASFLLPAHISLNY